MSETKPPQQKEKQQQSNTTREKQAEHTEGQGISDAQSSSSNDAGNSQEDPKSKFQQTKQHKK
jgi:hypothetical protein